MVASCELDTASIDVSPGRDVRDLSDSQTDARTLPSVCHSYQMLYLPQKGTQFCWNVVMLHLRLP